MFFLLLAAGALAWLAWRGRQALDLDRVPRPFALAAAAWIGIAVASLVWSVDPGHSLAELRREVLYGSIAFVVFFAGTRAARDLHLWVRALLASAMVAAGIAVLAQLLPQVQFVQRLKIGSNEVSMLVVLVAPLLVLCAWRGPTGLATRRGFIVGMALLLVLTAGLSENRMVWVALMAAGVIAFAVYRNGNERDSPANAKARRFLVYGLLVLPVLLAAAATHKALRYYPAASGPAQAVLMDDRPLIWAVAARIAEQRPVLGHGYGREIVGDAISDKLKRAGSTIGFRHGHNVFVDVALQLGIVGVAAFTALMATLALALERAGRHEDTRALAIAGLALLGGFLVKNLTDDLFFRPSSLLFWSIAGMLMGFAARRGDSR